MRTQTLALCLLAITAHADEGWQHTFDKNGVAYDKRVVPGSKFNEYRATFDAPISPSEVTPNGAGVHVVYPCYSEPGGSFPRSWCAARFKIRS